MALGGRLLAGVVLASATAVLATPSITPAYGAAAAVAPAMTLSVTVGPPTQTLTVNVVGLGPTEAVDVYFGMTDLALAVSGVDGSVTLPGFVIPASAQPGQAWVTAVGRRTGLAAQAPFLVRTDWPQLGFGPGHKGTNPYENTLTPATVGGLGRRWTSATGGSGDSVTVVGGVVYTGSPNGTVYALDATTGARRWSFATANWVNAVPAVVGGVVYVGSNDGWVYALDAATGARRWSFATGDAVESSPTVFGGVVYVGSDDGNLYALDAATGARRWSFATGGWPFAAPAVADGMVYVGVDLATSKGAVIGLDAATGTKRWSVSTPSDVYYAPVASGGIVYVTSTTAVYALNGAGGGSVWTFTPGMAMFDSPAVAGGSVYISSYLGDVYALDASTGAQRWHVVPVPQAHMYPPTVAGAVVYVPSANGPLYALDAGTGARLWTYSNGFAMNSTPVVANGMLLAGCADGSLYAFDLTANLNPNAAQRIDPRSLRPDPTLKPGSRSR